MSDQNFVGGDLRRVEDETQVLEVVGEGTQIVVLTQDEKIKTQRRLRRHALDHPVALFKADNQDTDFNRHEPVFTLI